MNKEEYLAILRKNLRNIPAEEVDGIMQFYIEYFEEAGGANIRLQWSSNLETKEVIPQSQLYSEIISALPDIEGVNLTPYPNPVSNVLHLRGLDNPAPLEIYNSQGVKISEQIGTSVNTGQLPIGLYYLQFEQDGKLHSFKFIKK